MIDVTTPKAEGILIDCSHLKNHDLTVSAARLAEYHGMPVALEDRALMDRYLDDADLTYEENESLDWWLDDILDWLNGNATDEGYAYVVMDNSLYYERIEEAD